MTSLILALFLLPNNPIDAIRAGSPVTRLTVGTYTLSETLSLPSNVTVICDKGAVIETAGGVHWGIHDPIVLINGSNVTMIGCTIRGRRDDWSKPPYEPSEWRHCLEIVAGKNIKLTDVTVAESGGDGVLITSRVDCDSSECRHPSENITIDRLTATGSYRNAIAITSCIGCTVRDSTLELTRGVSPNAGCDVEPDHPADRLEAIRFERCTARDNAASAFMVNLDRLTEKSKPISIDFVECRGERIPVGHYLFRVEQFGWNLNAVKPYGFIGWDSSIWSNSP